MNNFDFGIKPPGAGDKCRYSDPETGAHFDFKDMC